MSDGHHLYTRVPFVSEDDMTNYRWQVARIYPRLPVYFEKTPQLLDTPIGEAKVYYEQFDNMWYADLYINDYLSSWQLRDYYLKVCLEKKRITGIFLSQDKSGTYNRAIGSYSGVFLFCDCGAKHTSDPDHHMQMCPSYRKNP